MGSRVGFNMRMATINVEGTHNADYMTFRKVFGFDQTFT